MYVFAAGERTAAAPEPGQALKRRGRSNGAGVSAYFRRTEAWTGKKGLSAITRKSAPLSFASIWNVKILPETEEVMDEPDRKSTRLNSSHELKSRMPSSA